MAYLKPQSPIKYKEDHIYPPTTIDQVIMDNGQRLSGVCVYLDRPDEYEDTEVAGINADTLGGIPAGDFVLKTDTIENAVNATNAMSAQNANHALESDHAANANMAISADVATEADNSKALDGKSASAFAMAEQAVPSGGTTGQVLTKVSNDNNDVQWSDGGVNMELLWENASPTSNFAAQTISIDLTQYCAVLVKIGFHTTMTSDNDCSLNMCLMGEAIKLHNSVISTSTSFYHASAWRLCTVTKTGVTFGAGSVQQGTSTLSNSDNSRAIPMKIYGIKGVIS